MLRNKLKRQDWELIKAILISLVVWAIFWAALNGAVWLAFLIGGDLHHVGGPRA